MTKPLTESEALALLADIDKRWPGISNNEKISVAHLIQIMADVSAQRNITFSPNIVNVVTSLSDASEVCYYAAFGLCVSDVCAVCQEMKIKINNDEKWKGWMIQDKPQQMVSEMPQQKSLNQRELQDQMMIQFMRDPRYQWYHDEMAKCAQKPQLITQRQKPMHPMQPMKTIHPMEMSGANPLYQFPQNPIVIVKPTNPDMDYESFDSSSKFSKSLNQQQYPQPIAPPCANGRNCLNLRCQLSHPAIPDCRYGQFCNKGTQCIYNHPIPVQPWKGRIAPAKVDREIVETISQVQPIPCRYGTHCRNREVCRYVHPDSVATVANSQPSTQSNPRVANNNKKNQPNQQLTQSQDMEDANTKSNANNSKKNQPNQQRKQRQAMENVDTKSKKQPVKPNQQQK